MYLNNNNNDTVRETLWKLLFLIYSFCQWLIKKNASINKKLFKPGQLIDNYTAV